MSSKSIRQHCSGVEVTSNVRVSHFQFAVVTNGGILWPHCTVSEAIPFELIMPALLAFIECCEFMALWHDEFNQGISSRH